MASEPRRKGGVRSVRLDRAIDSTAAKDAAATGRSVSEWLRDAATVTALGVVLGCAVQPDVRRLGELEHDALIRSLRADLAEAAARAMPEQAVATLLDPGRPT
jgi:hypothetical protein